MNSREKLDEFVKLRGWNDQKLIGWSEASDFADWHAEQMLYELLDHLDNKWELLHNRTKKEIVETFKNEKTNEE